jgi:hypothetical protein
MWKKAVVILLPILILTGVAVYYLYPRRATYTLYGTEIIATTASKGKISTILPNIAWELGDCIIKEDGGKRFPSFHQGGRSWKDDAGNIIAVRGITEFNDKNGNHCIIEDIVIPGKPTVILLKSDTEESTMALANELMRQFRLFKIKYTE